MIKFVFDLDGTIIEEETRPLISKHFKGEFQIEPLAKETTYGDIPFMETLIRRVYLLGKLPVSEIANLLKSVVLHQQLFSFIQKY